MSKKGNRRIGLSTKLNAIIVISILVISIGLVGISYSVYSKKVDSLYYDRAEGHPLLWQRAMLHTVPYVILEDL